MKPTKQQSLQQLNAELRERKEYLKTIEQQIDDVTNNGNNAILQMHATVSELENEQARLLKENYVLDEQIREKKKKLARLD